MNNKGQITVGAILIAAIGLIVALVILSQAIIPQVGTSTSTATLNNLSYTASTTDLVRLQGVAWNDVVIYNVTGVLVESGNYTILNRQIDPTTGELTAQLNATQQDGTQGKAWNLSGTIQPEGYIADSGGRAITGLIAVFAALAIAVFALAPTLRNGVLDLIGR